MRLPSAAPLLRLVPPAPRPRVALPILFAVQWLAIGWLAQRAPHNGWLYYQGGDNSWYYTTAWNFAGGNLSPAVVGYAWSLVMAPFAAVFGANWLAALPALMLFQVIVLLPLAVACFYGLASRIAGRGFGFAATAFWIVAPFAAIPLFVERYHDRWVENFLPQMLGLGTLADLPSLVCLLGAAYLLVRALDTRVASDAVLAGVVTGFALGIKPANAIFLGAPLLAFALARRPRALAAFGAGLAPGVLALAVWKQRGLGTLPLFTFPEVRAAAGSVLPVGSLDTYLRVDFGQLGENFDQLREFFWSVRLLQWAPLAGLVGLARVSLPKAGLVAAWFFAFLFFKGASPGSTVPSGTFFRLLMPALPAYMLLFFSVVLAVPRLGPRLVRPLPAARRPRLERATAVGVIVSLALVPLALVAFLPTLKGQHSFQWVKQGTYIPQLDSFRLEAMPEPDGVHFSWSRPATNHTRVYFRLLQIATLTTDAPSGVSCQSPPWVPSTCFLVMDEVVSLHQTSTLRGVEPGAWAFRVGLATDVRNSPDADLIFVSPPVYVSVPDYASLLVRRT